MTHRFSEWKIRDELAKLQRLTLGRSFKHEEVKHLLNPNQLGALQRRGYLRKVRDGKWDGHYYKPVIWQLTEQTTEYLRVLNGVEVEIT